MIRVLIVDPSAAVRQGLRMRLSLEPDLSVVGEAGNGASAIAQAAALGPRVVLMELHMAGMDGIAVTAGLRRWAPATRVVMLSFDDCAAIRQVAVAAGAAGFVGKQEDFGLLLAAIRHAAASELQGPHASAA